MYCFMQLLKMLINQQLRSFSQFALQIFLKFCFLNQSLSISQLLFKYFLNQSASIKYLDLSVHFPYQFQNLSFKSCFRLHESLFTIIFITASLLADPANSSLVRLSSSIFSINFTQFQKHQIHQLTYCYGLFM
ncbi:hypothetical protein ABPG74_006204 [Tetrahymena malaccensis]